MSEAKTASPRIAAGLFLLASLLSGPAASLKFADFDNQSFFNHFSGDSGVFASDTAIITGVFDTQVFHGSSGASLRIDYSAEKGFCGFWNSLLGKESFPRHTLNFTNLHESLRNSAGHPCRVEGVQVTNFTFWARGNGQGNFEHAVKVEFKNTAGKTSHAVFTVSNATRWQRYTFPAAAIDLADVSHLKEMVFVIEDWRNDHRSSGTLYLDDLAFNTDEPAADPSRWADDAMLDAISFRAFAYFLRFTDELGFALDRSTFSDMVSVGTIGFQLTAYCVGHQRGWADPGELEGRVLGILTQLRRLPMGPEAGAVNGGYRGFYYHFLAADTGRRKDDNVELSLYDTMLLMYGVLTCREYFPNNPQIQRLSRELFDRVEWDWFVDRAPGPNRNRFFLDWHPEPNIGFHKHVDGQTDEAFMVDVLALGSRTHPVSLETYLARNRVFGRYPPDGPGDILVSWRGSLFNYFFASCWMNFESRGIDLHPVQPVDIWRNNRLAIEANRRFCLDHSSLDAGRANGRYATYGEKAWGLTACDNLVPPGAGAPSEYFAFGALPMEENLRFRTRALHAGTLAVYGAGSCINFLPEESIAALRHYFAIPSLWHPLFGFGDAFSLDPHYVTAPYDSEGNPTLRAATDLNGPWVNPMTMGVDVGPLLLAIENYREGTVWKLTAKNPEIVSGLNRIFGRATLESCVTVTARNGNGPVATLHWEPEPGAVEYAVFASTDLEDWRLIQDGIRETVWTDRALAPDTQRFYLVKALK